MRVGMRRFTRLTNALSKKVENHVHAISIYFMHYNFARIHQTPRCTPAMEASLLTGFGRLRTWCASWTKGKLPTNQAKKNLDGQAGRRIG